MFSVTQKLLITFSSLFQTAEGMFANKTKCIIVNLIADIVFINVLTAWLFSRAKDIPTITSFKGPVVKFLALKV